jgi:hypothetical protein
MDKCQNKNIYFFLDESKDNAEQQDVETNEEQIKKMMEELEQYDELNNLESEKYNCLINNDLFDYTDNDDLNYYIDKLSYNCDEMYYDELYTVKDLLKICKYYGIDKNIKSSKCKKPDIISTIIFFESLPENKAIVKQRHRMWAYVTELLNDKKMRKYILF